MPNTRVIVADDQVLVRAGIVAILEELGGYACVAAVSDGQQCIDACDRLLPDALLLDINMPGMDGLAVATHVRAAHPQVRILILTSSTGPELARKALELGVAGFVSKDFVLDELALALRSIADGRTYVSPDVALSTIREAGATGAPRLTPRQRDVLRGIAAGQSNKEIARDLAVSIKTVEYHRAELIQRLDLHDVASLTRFAVAHGLAD
ncbi:MAG: response regulator transcription factor [Aquabacterium sp.]